MNPKSLIVLTAAAALALPGLAAADHDGDAYEYARVVDVEPLYRYVDVDVPRQECWTETRYVRDYDDYGHGYRDRGRSSSALPTVAGGVIGGVVGRQFGSGKGRDAMTVLGTLVGAAVAHERSHDRYDNRYVSSYRTVRAHPVERCETRYQTRTERESDGYLVTYRYAGRTYTTRTWEHPGDRIRVRVDVTPTGA